MHITPTSRRRTIPKKATVLAATLSVACTATLLFFYEIVAERMFLEQHPPPGPMFDIGGRREYLQCAGVGTPTVVFEAGMGDSSVVWYSIMPIASKVTRACVYDRAGLGWSEGTHWPRSSWDIAEDLHVLLSRAKEQGPYILVGHSFGGYLIREYTQRFPSEVAGLVLVDAVNIDHPYQMSEFQQLWKRLAAQCPLEQVRARFGLLRLKGELDETYPVSIRSLVAGFGYSLAANRASCGEFDALIREVPAGARLTVRADLPVVVVSAGQNSLKGLPHAEELWKEWNESQADLVHLSARTTQMVAKHSQHYVQFGEPQILTSAILEVLSQTR